MTNRQLLMAALLAASSLGATSAVAQTASPLSPGLHFLSHGTCEGCCPVRERRHQAGHGAHRRRLLGSYGRIRRPADGKKLVNDLGDFENPSLLRPYSSELADRPWGGEGLYAAGGTIAIRTAGFSTPRPATWRAR
mgnify:CR=1 FL=1